LTVSIGSTDVSGGDTLFCSLGRYGPFSHNRRVKSKCGTDQRSKVQR
jgi:hypothetical protein